MSRKKGCGGRVCRRGTVGELITAGMCVIAMTIMMTAFLGNIRLLDQKEKVGQIARKYILRMETVGYLTANDRQSMLTELAAIGAKEVDLSGSTVNRVDYGSPVILKISGKIDGVELLGSDLLGMLFAPRQYAFEESRMSTAKN